MGRIFASVTITNLNNKEKFLQCDAMVDTGAAYMTLPTAWRDKLGDLEVAEVVDLETADQKVIKGEICTPVYIQIEGFRRITSEVLFIDMEPEDGLYEPLIGYLVLEQSQAGVDILGHRLVKIKHVDLKSEQF
jgi:predicted aspartyl protease